MGFKFTFLKVRCVKARATGEIREFRQGPEEPRQSPIEQ